MWGQLPPNQRRSMTATLAPRARASYAAASPAGPAPITTKSNVSIRSVWRVGGRSTLSDRLVEQHRGRDRDVEAVGSSGHRDRDGIHPWVPPGRRQAIRLAPEDKRERPAQVGIHVDRGGVDDRRDRPDAAADQ